MRPVAPAEVLVGDPLRRVAGLGAQQVGLGEREQVAFDLDIDIVFERQGDRVLKRQIELAVAEKGFDAAGVG